MQFPYETGFIEVLPFNTSLVLERCNFNRPTYSAPYSVSHRRLSCVPIVGSVSVSRPPVYSAGTPQHLPEHIGVQRAAHEALGLPRIVQESDLQRRNTLRTEIDGLQQATFLPREHVQWSSVHVCNTRTAMSTVRRRAPIHRVFLLSFLGARKLYRTSSLQPLADAFKWQPPCWGNR